MGWIKSDSGRFIRHVCPRSRGVDWDDTGHQRSHRAADAGGTSHDLFVDALKTPRPEARPNKQVTSGTLEQTTPPPPPAFR